MTVYVNMKAFFVYGRVQNSAEIRQPLYEYPMTWQCVVRCGKIYRKDKFDFQGFSIDIVVI